MKFSEPHLVVDLKNSIYIFNVEIINCLNVIKHTYANPRGLFCLSSLSESSYFAYLGSKNTIELCDLYTYINKEFI